MSRKDYELIAKVFAVYYKDLMSGALGHRDADDAHDDLAKRLAHVFACDNPRFNRNKFLHACDVDGY